MKAMRFVRKNWIPLLILIILLLLVRNYYNVERFQATTVRYPTGPGVPPPVRSPTTCPAGKTLKCPAGYPNRNNALCYQSCRSGHVFAAGLCNNKSRVADRNAASQYRPESVNAQCL